MSWTIRYVGFLGFIFMFTNFHSLDLHNQTCATIANLQWNICKNQILNRTESEQFILFILNFGDKIFLNIRLPACLVR